MSVKNVVSFFNKLEQDEFFRNKLAKNEKLKDKSLESVMAVAAVEGFSFTEEEFKQAQEDMKDMELSEKELEKVTGGCGLGVCFGVGYGLYGPLESGFGWSSEPELCLGFGITPPS